MNLTKMRNQSLRQTPDVYAWEYDRLIFNQEKAQADIDWYLTRVHKKYPYAPSVNVFLNDNPDRDVIRITARVQHSLPSYNNHMHIEV